jgi:hypothetical protein
MCVISETLHRGRMRETTCLRRANFPAVRCPCGPAVQVLQHRVMNRDRERERQRLDGGRGAGLRRCEQQSKDNPPLTAIPYCALCEARSCAVQLIVASTMELAKRNDGTATFVFVFPPQPKPCRNNAPKVCFAYVSRLATSQPTTGSRDSATWLTTVLDCKNEQNCQCYLAHCLPECISASWQSVS